MKNTFLLTATLFLFVSIGFAQAPSIQWQKSFGGSSDEQAFPSQQTSDGGYIIGGSAWSNNGDVSGNHGNQEMWVVKTDAAGNLTWQKALGGSSWETAFYTQQTADGGYILAGYTYSNDGNVSGNHGGQDVWVVKLDGSGNLTWQKTLGGSSYEEARSIQQTADGGYIVAGYTYSNNGDVSGNHGVTADLWLVKLTSTGSITWQKTLGGTGHEVANMVRQTADGGYITAGWSNSNDGNVSGVHGDYDYWVVKLNASGVITWQKAFGGSASDYAQSVRQTPEGGYVVLGYTNSNNGDVSGNHGDNDYWVVKLTSTGNLTWQKTLGGSAGDFGLHIQNTTDGGYVVAGFTASNNGDVTGNHGGYDYWVVKLTGAGSIVWQKALGGTLNDFGRFVQQTQDGGFVVMGYSASNNGDVTGNHGGDDYWVVKLGPEVTQLPTTGLKLFMPFCGNANDASGLNHNGVVSNATLTTDRFGNPNSAYFFNGTNAYISVADHADLKPTNITIACWAQADVTASTHYLLYIFKTYGGGAGAAQSYGLYANSGSHRPWGIIQATEIGSTFSSATQWHHMAMTFDNPTNSLKLYVNGALATSMTYTGNIPYGANPDPLTIGVEYEGGSLAYWHKGKIDDVLMYNRALTATEIAAVYSHSLCTASAPAPIPTLSEWGLIIFALMLLCIGSIAVWNTRYGVAYSKA